MSGDILNIALHESDSATVVNWMLWRWGLNPQAKLIIITHESDGQALDNRIRVTLTSARTAMRRAGIRNYQRFGFTTAFSDWTTLSGMKFDAVYASRFVHSTHIMSEAVASLGIDFGIEKESSHGRH